MRPRLAAWLRRTADRIDHQGAPRLIGHSFTFEIGEGIRFRDDGKGCPLAYLSERDYGRAHDEADVTWERWRDRRDQIVAYSLELTSEPLLKPGDRGTINGIPATVLECRPVPDSEPDVQVVLATPAYLAVKAEGARDAR